MGKKKVPVLEFLFVCLFFVIAYVSRGFTISDQAHLWLSGGDFCIFNIYANIVYLYLWRMMLVQVSGLGPWKLDKQ